MLCKALHNDPLRILANMKAGIRIESRIVHPRPRYPTHEGWSSSEKRYYDCCENADNRDDDHGHHLPMGNEGGLRLSGAKKSTT